MKSELTHLGLGFIEGFVLILSPCILSILPLILANSLIGSRRRLIGIALGFIGAFTLLAFFARNLVQYSGIDWSHLRVLAFGIFFLLGVILLSNYLTEKWNKFLQRLLVLMPIKLPDSQDGFLKGLLTGAALAFIWTPCAGPILAAILVQIAVGETTFFSFLILLSFASGAFIPILFVAFQGLKLRDTFLFFKQHSAVFRKLLGVIILLNLGYMIYLQEGFEPSSIPTTGIRTVTYLENGLWRPYAAPSLAGIDYWINSEPLNLSDFKGKVVLVDFWTYSCINCIRTLPYLNYWYHKYYPYGLIIIGVHAPEFDFEKNFDNVKEAVKRYNILYPVALDNHFTTWRNFSNHYWPAHYLINKEGKVVYEHFGEGEYETLDNNLRFLLEVDKIAPPAVMPAQSFSLFQTPETYLGYARATSGPDLIRDQVAEYLFFQTLPDNAWTLQGFWAVAADKIIAAKGNAALRIHFNARKVYIVMGSSTARPIPVQILLDGKPKLSLLVNSHKLYEILDLPKFGNGVLEVIAEEPGLEVYTFTFGG